MTCFVFMTDGVDRTYFIITSTNCQVTEVPMIIAANQLSWDNEREGLSSLDEVGIDEIRVEFGMVRSSIRTGMIEQSARSNTKELYRPDHGVRFRIDFCQHSRRFSYLFPSISDVSTEQRTAVMAALTSRRQTGCQTVNMGTQSGKNARAFIWSITLQFPTRNVLIFWQSSSFSSDETRCLAHNL